MLLVQGGRDRLTAAADAADLLSLLSAARALVLPRSGHLVPLRAPTVRRAVREFLSAERGASRPGRAAPRQCHAPDPIRRRSGTGTAEGSLDSGSRGVHCK